MLSTQRFDDAWLRDVAAGLDGVQVVQHPADRVEGLPPELLREAEVLYTDTCLPTRRQAPCLRWVQLDRSGADHVVDTELWTDEEVVITSIGGVSPEPIAGFALLMILSFAYRLPALLEHQRRQDWPSVADRWERFMPAPLDGATLVVVGYGRVGRAIGTAARAFGLHVVGVRRGAERPGERLGEGGDDATVEIVAPERLHEVLARADYVAVAVPLTAATHHLLDEAAFAALKPGAVLVDVARGGVVDEVALRHALDSGRLAWAASDVFGEEPLPPGHPLWTHPRMTVTPHVAGYARDYRERVLDLFRTNLGRYAAGEPLINRIDRTLGY